MTQLHDLFGPALDDPATRTRLTLALAWGTAGAPNCLPAVSSATTSPALLQDRRRPAG
jgi:hypothetical protein